METKDYILTNATELFNRQGATATSMRQLAAHLDMSDGNLRYHFRTKEDLVTAIFRQMLLEMDAAINTENIERAALMEEVRKQFRSVFFTMYRYKFLFIESNLLLKQYEVFRQSFIELMEARKAFFLHFFQEYKADGFFNKQIPHARYEMIFEQIFIISDNWIKYVELERTSPDSIDKKIDHYIDLCLVLLEGLAA
ncbi:TetR/AcrR family transcriptional regulator [Cesiribacter sp. SM1]|uniref:TetR/AcrR family transcriptional regulator n=1 Tax=Cesiribacter sp. SM1 TaxID=2861196 RepID=UPI001CD7D2A3|nr:TetR/AcrR family transcriptional regulator [Cesiribacter sp. SM1]